MEKEKFLKQFVHKQQDIRAVGIEGSLTTGRNDEFSDIDITFFTTTPDLYTEDDQWLDFFGPRIIMQKPGAYYLDDENILTPYLMLFENGERIDLKIGAVEAIEAYVQSESTVQIILDRDHRLMRKIEPNETTFFIQKPSEEEFLETVNEFFWVVPYVLKGYIRREFLYTTKHIEIIRTQLIQVICWGIAAAHDYQLNLGSHEKYLQQYMEEEQWRKLVETYCCSDYDQIKQSLLCLIELMEQQVKKVASINGYTYLEENNRVIAYVKNKLAIR